MQNNKLNLLNLPWEDILFENVLSRLSLKDLYTLRCVSKNFQEFVESYLESCRYINLANQKKFDLKAFHVLLVCRQVRKINVSKCTWLDNSLFSIFLLNNDHIMEVNLNYCSSLNSRSIQVLFVHCPNLKCLQMASCEWLSTGAVDTLTFHHGKLETIDFSKCVLLSERCIVKMVIKFYNIKNLSLAHIPSISDCTIFTIATHCPDLENLNIDGCVATIKAIRLLIVNCQKLESVKITGRLLTKQNFLKPYS